jgi:CheY-like chemotaxis protein
MSMDTKTILIADDETHILNVLSIKLQNAGYNVITAEDGAEAYELACTQKPDLVITDYQMPRLSGLELCSKLTCDPATSDVSAILLTARGFAMSEEDMRLGNIKEVITKPFSPRKVLSRVQELLGEAAPAAEVA